MFLRFILAQVYRITLLALQVTTSCDGKMMRSQQGIMRSMQVSMSHQSSHIISDQISALFCHIYIHLHLVLAAQFLICPETELSFASYYSPSIHPFDSSPAIPPLPKYNIPFTKQPLVHSPPNWSCSVSIGKSTHSSIINNIIHPKLITNA